MVILLEPFSECFVVIFMEFFLDVCGNFYGIFLNVLWFVMEFFVVILMESPSECFVVISMEFF